MVYEVVAFQALRDQFKYKEIWVVGADKWRNPGEDLPQDFGALRGELPRAAQAARCRRVRRRAARADDHRTDTAERPDAHAELVGHRRAEVRGDPADPG
ncbi:hypothetical protein [Streptomyces sp. NPDC000994]